MKKRKLFVPFIFCLLISLSILMNAEAASSVKLNKTSITIQVGKTYNLKVKGTKKKVKWKTANKKVATVNSKGKVTGKKAGTTTVTAEVGKKTLKCKVIVKKGKILSVNKTSIKIKNKGTIKVTFKGDTTISYDISDPDIISCKWEKGWNGDNTKLFITGKKSGVAYVTISNDDNDEEVIIKVTVNKGTVNNGTGGNETGDNGTEGNGIPTVDMTTRIGVPYSTDSSYSLVLGGFGFTVNSVNGIKFLWKADNNSNKTINYYTVTLYFYNAVGDPAYDEITGKCTKTVKYVGPVQPNSQLLIYNIVGYVPACSKIVVGDITLDYSDGTSETGWYGYYTSRRFSD